MKKKVLMRGSILVILILLLVGGIHMYRFSDFSKKLCLNYHVENEDGRMTIGVNKVAKCCFMGNFEWDGTEEQKTIVVPDVYDGMKVTALGGYYGRGAPAPFSIHLPQDYITDFPEDSEFEGVFLAENEEELQQYHFSRKYQVENISFAVLLGKNIGRIEEIAMNYYFPFEREDGELVFYHPVVTVICDGENDTYYSEQGKLYERETKELVKGFAYDD